MTQKQAIQFNMMLTALRSIAKNYSPPAKLRRIKNDGLQYEERLEMAYENIQQSAKDASHGVKPLDISKGMMF